MEWVFLFVYLMGARLYYCHMWQVPVSMGNPQNEWIVIGSCLFWPVLVLVDTLWYCWEAWRTRNLE